MRLYALYALVVAGIVIASVAATPGLRDITRRVLIAAVSLLVVVPAALLLIAGVL
jgi:hypothetical protein